MEFPPEACNRLHIDFAGSFHYEIFLIVIDAYSKWSEISEMRSTARTQFARQGVPAEIKSENGPQFCSEEFRKFMEFVT